MSDKRTALIVNLIMGTLFLVLSAVLFIFSRTYVKSPTYMIFSDDELVYSTVPEDRYAIVDKDTLFTAEDYVGFTLYYTPNGKKWHLTKECQYIRNSKTVYNTDYNTAVANGLSACSDCGYPDERPD